MRRAADNNNNKNDDAAKAGGDGRIVVFVDPPTRRPSPAVRLIEDWSDTEGLILKSVRRLDPGAEINPACRLAVVNVGGRSVASRAVLRTVETLRNRFPGAPVVVMSELNEQSEVFAAFHAGVQGFIPASLDPKVALQALTFIMVGGSYFPSSALVSSIGTKRGENLTTEEGSASEAVPAKPAAGPDSGLLDILTPRQRQVALLLKEGLSNRVIARRLGVSEATVKVHIRQIMSRLKISNRTQLALAIHHALSR